MAEEWPGEEEALLYLLGEMAEEAQAAFEVRMLGSLEAQERVERLEMELIDRYLLGRLEARQRGRFEEHYLSNPARRERVELGRVLIGELAAPAPARAASWWRRGRLPEGLLAAACLVLALATTYFALEARRARASRQVSFTPSAGSARGEGDLPTLVIPSGVVVVRLELPLPPGAYGTYRAVLQSVDGVPLWRADPLPVVFDQGAGTGLLLTPASVLRAGEYVVSVSGQAPRGQWEELASYVLRVRP